MRRLAALVVSLGVSSLLLAAHPSSIETALNDGGIVSSQSFTSDFLVYKSIGGRTEVKAKEEERQWWCRDGRLFRPVLPPVRRFRVLVADPQERGRGPLVPSTRSPVRRRSQPKDPELVPGESRPRPP